MAGIGDIAFEGRREERFETSWLVEIAHPTQGRLQVAARDVSLTGARLAVPEGIDLPETFAFRIVGKDFVVKARLVWRQGNYAGIAVERTAKLPAPGSHAKEVQSLGPGARKDDTVVLGHRSYAALRDRHGN